MAGGASGGGGGTGGGSGGSGAGGRGPGSIATGGDGSVGFKGGGGPQFKGNGDLIEVDDVDAVCEQVAIAYCEKAMELMLSECANDGQTALIEDQRDEVFEQVEIISQGEQPDWAGPDHPEAVGMIAEDGMQVLIEGAYICLAIRVIDEALKEAA